MHFCRRDKNLFLAGGMPLALTCVLLYPAQLDTEKVLNSI